MQWTGNLARTFGQVLLALAIVALVLGVLAIVVGAVVLDNMADNPELADDGGDLLEALASAGGALLLAGTLLLVAAIVVLGVARGLRERLQRRSSQASAPPLPTKDSGTA